MRKHSAIICARAKLQAAGSSGRWAQAPRWPWTLAGHIGTFPCSSPRITARDPQAWKERLHLPFPHPLPSPE